MHLRHHRVTTALSILVVAVVGCSDADVSQSSAAAADAVSDAAGHPLAYAPCIATERAGGFGITLADKYTGVHGQVLDGVVPLKASVVVDTRGACRLMRVPNPICTPGCTSGQVCKGDGASGGTCIPHPVGRPVGDVAVHGLKAPLTMAAKWGNSYTNPGALPHPGFDPGDPLTLSADGGDYEGFTLRGRGVGPLSMAAAATGIVGEQGKPGELRGQPPSGAAQDPVKIRAEVRIDNHGSSTGWIACDTADTGALSVHADLVDALYAMGVSGFPSITLSRRSADSTTIAPGCVDLIVRADLDIPVEIAGVTSCTDDKDCEAGKSCAADLTCQ